MLCLKEKPPGFSFICQDVPLHKHNLKDDANPGGFFIEYQNRYMKKICLVIHSLGIGGMERVMSQLAINFSERENTVVHLVLIGIKRDIAYELPASVQIHRPHFEFNNSRRTVDTLRTIRFLRSEVKDIDPDVILSFGEMWNNLVLLSLYGFKYPVYISDRSQPDKDLGKLHNYLKKKLYPKAAGVIAQTETAKSICLSRGLNKNVKVIGNPIREIKSNGEIEKENIILTVGRLIRTKHIDQLIKMFTEINQPGWKLVIVGGDAKKLTLSEDLRRLISELDTEDSVFLEGEQRDIDKYYNRSKIFAFTSSSEGFPNVVGEALSAGLPVISYDCVAGPSDMIAHGENGYLIPLYDQKEFKNKLKLLMTDDQLRRECSLNSKSKIKKFNIDDISNQVFKFILR